MSKWKCTSDNPIECIRQSAIADFDAVRTHLCLLLLHGVGGLDTEVESEGERHTDTDTDTDTDTQTQTHTHTKTKTHTDTRTHAHKQKKPHTHTHTLNTCLHTAGLVRRTHEHNNAWEWIDYDSAVAAQAVSSSRNGLQGRQPPILRIQVCLFVCVCVSVCASACCVCVCVFVVVYCPLLVVAALVLPHPVVQAKRDVGR